EIVNCSIHDFQKNGITANETGTTVQIHRNVITGLGPVTGAAQNGIQIGFNAGGSIRSNIVTNNVWSPCTSTSSCDAVGTNIVTEAPIGILKATGSTGNIIAHNEFFNVAVKVQDPVLGDLAGRVQPER